MKESILKNMKQVEGRLIRIQLAVSAFFCGVIMNLKRAVCMDVDSDPVLQALTKFKENFSVYAIALGKIAMPIIFTINLLLLIFYFDPKKLSVRLSMMGISVVAFICLVVFGRNDVGNTLIGFME